jgi:RecB family exonuclease
MTTPTQFKEMYDRFYKQEHEPSPRLQYQKEALDKLWSYLRELGYSPSVSYKEDARQYRLRIARPEAKLGEWYRENYVMFVTYHWLFGYRTDTGFGCRNFQRFLSVLAYELARRS